jgi:hypothetical protein
MRKIIWLLLFTTTFCFAQQRAEIAYTIKEKDLIAEGIAHDAKTSVLYVGSIQKNKILKITKQGEVTDFVKTNQDSILSVLGMGVDQDGNLWACNNTPESDSINKISNVHVYTSEGKLKKVYTLNDGKKHLFNDLYFHSSGDTYITDSEGRSVYRIAKNSDVVEEFIPSGKVIYPNGISATKDGKKLLVATGSGLGIVSVDLTTREVVPVRHAKFILPGLDGLYRYKNTLIAVQNILYPESVLKLQLSEDETKIANMEFLTTVDPTFDLPTTGVIAGDTFYFIGNSQLSQIQGNKGKIKNPATLTDTYIMKIKIN